MSSLITAKVNVGVPYFRKIEDEPSYFDQVDELLRGLASTKSLYLKGSTMDVLRGADHHNLQKFSNLSYLHLRVLNFFSWDALPILLQNAPNLKVLVLKKDFKSWYAKFTEDYTWYKPQEVPVCLSKTLLKIEIWNCEARQVELDLISYLLQNGKVLNTFMVDLLAHSSEEQSKFYKTIMMVPKGSETCQIKISALTSCPTLSRAWPDYAQKTLELSSIPQRLTYEDLNLFTNGFDCENLISITPLSKVYRGKMLQHGSDSKVKSVTVKQWINYDRDQWNQWSQEKRTDYRLQCFHAELKLLQHPYFSSHPYFLRLLGYCEEDDNQRFGVVYDFEPLDILESLVPKDSFNWLQRIKVALGLACILEYMHKKAETSPTMVLNLDAAFIMLDQDYNPVLFDFSRVSGGIFSKRVTYEEWSLVCECIGWGQEYERDPCSVAYKGYPDVFAYGIILLGLISKRVYERDFDKRHKNNYLGIYKWAHKEYRPFFHEHKVSLVHQSLKAHTTFDSADGLQVTSLAMHCVALGGSKRPRMKGVVKCLLGLHIVKQYWDLLECDKMLSFLDS